MLRAASGNARLLRGLPYVVEGLLAALLDLIDADSFEGRQQLAVYRVRRACTAVAELAREGRAGLVVRESALVDVGVSGCC